MKISVITPVYNGGKVVEGVIQSVLSQTYIVFEHVIIDGGSTDDTLSILQKNPHLKWVSEPDKGIYDAMNKGVDLATGDFLLFMGADDIFLNKYVIENLVNKHSKALLNNDIVYGDVVFSEWCTFSKNHEQFELYNFLKYNLNHQSVFYKKSIFEKVGKFSLNYPVFADWEFNIRCFFNPLIKTKYIPLTIASFSIEGVSNTSKDAFLEDKTKLIKKLLPDLSKRKLLQFHLNVAKDNTNRLRVIFFSVLLFGVTLKSKLIKK